MDACDDARWRVEAVQLDRGTGPRSWFEVHGDAKVFSCSSAEQVHQVLVAHAVATAIWHRRWMTHRRIRTAANERVLRRCAVLIEPMLATLGQPPAGEEVAFEFKWDGIRCVAYVDAQLR